MRAARRGQAVVISPFACWSHSASHHCSAVTQQNAEGLAAVALLQHVSKGTPVVYGAFTNNVDMKTRPLHLVHQSMCGPCRCQARWPVDMDYPCVLRTPMPPMRLMRRPCGNRFSRFKVPARAMPTSFIMRRDGWKVVCHQFREVYH